MSLKNHLKSLRQKHAEIDGKVRAEESRPLPDTLVVRGLKLRKAQLKTEITEAEKKLEAESAPATAEVTADMEDEVSPEVPVVNKAA